MAGLELPIPEARSYVARTGVFYDRESGRRASSTFSRGRVCAHPDCITVLSIYNSDDRCSVHRIPKHPSAHAFRPRPNMVKIINDEIDSRVNGKKKGKRNGKRK